MWLARLVRPSKYKLSCTTSLHHLRALWRCRYYGRACQTWVDPKWISVTDRGPRRGRGEKVALLRAKPSKDGDAEPRDYRDTGR